jgi:hypothetical protein
MELFTVDTFADITPVFHPALNSSVLTGESIVVHQIVACALSRAVSNVETIE